MSAMSATNALCVMKFGGTSVGDADCMRRAAAIVQAAAAKGPVVVVVSAMSGVTNRLIDAARHAEVRRTRVFAEADLGVGRAAWPGADRAGRRRRAAAPIEKALAEVLAELDRLLQGTALLRELTPRVLDAISGIGERLSAPLVAGALLAIGVRSRSIAATEVIVTDAHHGRAEPLMPQTRQRSEARLRPLLNDGSGASGHGIHRRHARGRANDAGPRRIGLFGHDSRRRARRRRNHDLDRRGWRENGRPAAGA